MHHNKISNLLLSALLLCSLHCDKDKNTPPPSKNSTSQDHAPQTNRVDVPETVRRNLGISFAKVESRTVAETLRVPGRFELQPQARREYRTMLSGRVELLVKQFDTISIGTPLYRLASPEWRELQQNLNQSIASIRQIEARAVAAPALLAAHHNHEEILREGVTLWESRLAQVEKSATSGAVSVAEFTGIKNTLATKRAELAEVLEKEAELKAQSATVWAEHDAAHARFRLLLSTASTLVGLSEAELAAPFPLDGHFHAESESTSQPEPTATPPAPHWSEINEIEVKATMPGVVASTDLTNGAWVATGDLVLATVEPDRLRFRARAMQSDLGRLRDGLPARIVPPKSASIAMQDTIDATLKVGLLADPEERTVELVAEPSRIAPWARAGVSAHLEIVMAGGQAELAVPLSCVIQDGLEKVIFRRDPKDPDHVIRVTADLGINDGRWVVINSGVMEGDEVVLDGVYQLMIATSGTVQKGGHFHADGTFHASEDEK